MMALTQFMAQIMLLVVICFFSILMISNQQSLCPIYPTCNCTKQSEQFDIFCNNLTDLTTITELLSGQFLHQKLDMVAMKYCSVTELPATVFNVSKIVTIISYCPFREMDDSSLSVVKSLVALKLYNTTFKYIPKAVSLLPKLKTLFLVEGKLLEIKDELQNLVSLTALSLYENAIEFVAKDAFAYNTALRTINLDQNNLKILPPTVFDSLVNVLSISVARNYLRNAEGLFNHTSIEHIRLGGNLLESIDTVFPQAMRLQTLDLERNPLLRITSSAFYGKISQLQQLTLRFCNLWTLDAKLLKPLQFLTHIDLSHTNVSIIPFGFFHDLRYLLEVNLSFNMIVDIQHLFSNNPALENVNLSENKIQVIGSSFLGLRRLKSIQLNSNHIRQITQIDLGPSLKKLEVLHLDGNKVEFHDAAVFSNLLNLQTLELSGCRIKNLNGTIKNLSFLKTLKLKSNKFTVLEANDFSGLRQLTSLELQHNLLMNVNGAFRKINSLSMVNLAKNRLMNLSSATFDESAPIKELWLGSSEKWICDCRLLWLQKRIQADAEMLKDDPSCGRPPRLRHKPLKNLTAEDLTTWTENCPEHCDCTCEPRVTSYFIRANCSGRSLSEIPSDFPEFLGDLLLSDNNLSDTKSLNRSIFKRLQSLDLERNGIGDLQFDLPSSLTILKLAGCEITRPSPPILSEKRWSQLTLSENPWICDCETIIFREWLLGLKENITDINEVRCDPLGTRSDLNGKLIWRLSEEDLCPPGIKTYIIIIVGTLAVLLFGSLSFVTYSRYQLHMRVWLYSRGITFVKEDDVDDSDKFYDAYVSFTDSEDDIVWNMLIPELELKVPFYSLCVPERNILAGALVEMAEKIRAITLSKRTIVLLTNNYLSDSYCKEEFEVALASFLDTKLQRIIVVVCGDLPAEDCLSQSLKTILKSSSCIRLGERLFWEKLRFAMPKKTVAESARNAALCITSGTEEGIQCSDTELLLS